MDGSGCDVYGIIRSFGRKIASFEKLSRQILDRLIKFYQGDTIKYFDPFWCNLLISSSYLI